MLQLIYLFLYHLGDQLLAISTATFPKICGMSCSLQKDFHSGVQRSCNTQHFFLRKHIPVNECLLNSYTKSFLQALWTVPQKSDHLWIFFFLEPGFPSPLSLQSHPLFSLVQEMQEIYVFISSSSLQHHLHLLCALGWCLARQKPRPLLPHLLKGEGE